MFDNRGARDALVVMREAGEVIELRVAGDSTPCYALPEVMESLPARLSNRVSAFAL